MTQELVLCVGMHRSGTSLTASLLQAIGLPLPGELITGDAANPTGYFENNRVVDAQETLLQSLGYWWPTESASHGLPPGVEHTALYREHVTWLTEYLEQLFQSGQTQLAIKDPRSSLLLPAWREAVGRLNVGLKLVICLRHPRDVCWSLVWRDGPSVGMGWSRAQRLWLEHYRALLVQGSGLPAQVAVYETWLQPAGAAEQLLRIANFLNLKPSAGQIQTALKRVKPEFNHGGAAQLPGVDPSLLRLHQALTDRDSQPGTWRRVARRSYRALKRHQLQQTAGIRLQLLWLRTPWGRRQLGPALDPNLLKSQLGRNSLRLFRKSFSRHRDLRPHVLISPAHLNQERTLRGLPPLRNADELFQHLLHPDLIPLNPHPWFDCRTYQQASQTLGKPGKHPVLTYLRRAQQERTNPYAHPLWLASLGADRRTDDLEPLPPILQRLHPGLVLADPVASLGDPQSDGPEVVRAHEAYWKQVADTFSVWQSPEERNPLDWLAKQPGIDKLFVIDEPLARDLCCWWLPGDWSAPLLAGIAGADPNQCRIFDDPEALIQGLETHEPHHGCILLTITPTILLHLMQRNGPLPKGVAVLNLVWPQPELQSAWLQILAGATLVLEHRPAIRVYLQSAGLRAHWRTPPALGPKQTGGEQRPTLLLAMSEGWAEAQLAQRAAELDANRYDAYLRVDAQAASLGDSPTATSTWFEQLRLSHGRWVWLNGPPGPADERSWAVLSWAQQNGVHMDVVDGQNRDDHWLDPLYR